VILPLIAALSVLGAAAQAQILEDFEQGKQTPFKFQPTATGADKKNLEYASAAAHDGNLGARFTGNLSGWYWRNNYSARTQPGQTIYGYVRFNSDPNGLIADGRAYIGVGATASGALSMVAAGLDSEILLQLNTDYGFTTLAEIPCDIVSDTWYRMEIEYGNGTATANLYDESRSDLMATTGPVSISFAQTGGLAFRGFTNNDASIDMDTVGIAPPGSAVSGKVTLTGCMNPAQRIAFQFRPTDGSAPFSQTETLASDGTFRITDIPPNTYNLAIKGAKWLQRVVAIDATQDVTGLSVTLLAGDVNNDNIVNAADLTLLSDAYQTTPNDAHWNPNADLNCDNIVNIMDLGLLADAYGNSGDP
jgi:hypothetical protein